MNFFKAWNFCYSFKILLSKMFQKTQKKIWWIMNNAPYSHYWIYRCHLQWKPKSCLGWLHIIFENWKGILVNLKVPFAMKTICFKKIEWKWQFWPILYKKNPSTNDEYILPKYLSPRYSVLFWIDVFCLPVGLYSILNPALVWLPSDWNWIKTSLLEETWLGGIESPQYFPIMADVLEPPSYITKKS